MKIDSYAVAMSATSTSVKSYSVTEQFVAASSVNSGAQQITGNAQQAAAMLNLSEEGQEQLQEQLSNNQQQLNNETARTEQSRQPFGINFMDEYRVKLLMLEQLYTSLTGKRYDFNALKMLSLDDLKINNDIRIPNAGPQQINLSFQRTETYYEYQEMSFEATGIVKTADGRQIQFDMNVMMSHEFYTSNSTTIDIALQTGRLCDPLVVSFDGLLPSFTEDRYEFDLIVGGELENIFMPTNGSGFLALDKNGNGVIDDGSELFGAATGNGFAELAAYDDDGNGWIDENDTVFEQLKIMFMDKESGEFMLVSLKEAGIGAIYLGSADTNYEINSDKHETQGIIRKSGFFLYENGNSGSIHHIDLTY